MANYQLRLRVEIMQVGEHGEYLSGPMGNLQVTEDLQFTASSFLEIAHKLGQFHELAEKIREQEHG